MNTPELERLTEEVRGRGIDTRIQHTYFGTEVAVHIHGWNEPAAIYSDAQFLRWAEAFLRNHP